MTYIIGRRFWICRDSRRDVDTLGSWLFHRWYNGFRILGIHIEKSK